MKIWSLPYKAIQNGFCNLAAQLNAGTILPERIVIITLLVVLVADLIVGRSSSRWVPYVASQVFLVRSLPCTFKGMLPIQSPFLAL